MKIKLGLLFLLLQNQIFAQKLVVQCTNNNILYAGIEYELVLGYEGVKNEDLLVKSTDNCILRHVESATYMATPVFGKPICKVYVGLKKHKGKKWLDSMTFEIKSMTRPKVLVGDLEGERMAVEDLIKQDSLQVKVESILKNIKFRISKYSLIILPKPGQMSDFSRIGSKLDSNLKKAFALLKDGDIIVIDRIRAIGPGGERPLNPITIVIQSKGSINFYEKRRIEGYYRDSIGSLKIYRFPISIDQVYEECGMHKDSIWKYWNYNEKIGEFRLAETDSFNNGKLVVSAFFNDSNGRKMYQIRPFTDSTSLYESYYFNGDIYQKGLVRRNTNKIEFSKTMFYSNGQTNTNKPAWYLCLNGTPDYLFPVGEWEVYDSNKNLQMVVNYAKFINSNLGCRTDPEWPWMEYYYIAPHGKCFLYKNGKLLETIHLNEGVVESRKRSNN